ncbi:MAG: GPR endopeptidase [Oscillospiraceae bacterium]
MDRFVQRTDLALEARELAGEKASLDIDGVEFHEEIRSGFKCQILDVANDIAAKALGKPIGTYYTLEIASLLRRESENFYEAASVISDTLKSLLGDTTGDGCTLVVGLGNRDITPDAIGPLSAASTLVTRHLKYHAPKEFAAFSPVAVITPGVLGTSGIESADYIKAVCDDLKPTQVIVIDALAARGLDRLCRTIQITDTGITPGSGVGNSRAAINSSFLGLPVIAVGVPTVVDIRCLLADFGSEPLVGNVANEMIVTPRNIDSEVACASRLVGYAINLALHRGLTVEDVDMLLG